MSDCGCGLRKSNKKKGMFDLIMCEKHYKELDEEFSYLIKGDKDGR